MLTLSLFRHAKSGWDDAHLKDIDRPLSERGLRAAAAMGAYMSSEAIRPELVLASPSVRTRETCRQAFAAMHSAPEITFEDVVYLASPRTLLALIRRTPASVGHLMVVGHNPGLHALALELVAKAERKPLAALTTKLPTAGLVVLEFDLADWSRVSPRTAHLARFMTPAMLDA